ncbi:MAG: hypothetical protein H7326_07370 [Bdellovibrionaceae bacterium]|nr:hypothetical protein [Pseudobdellovibrionaceae bacterium]
MDLSVPYTLDTLVGQGNYSDALQKMWLGACQSLECKQSTLRVLVRYLLNGEGAKLPGNEARTFLANFEQQFKSRFPNGLKLPDAKVPNRDPLKERNRSQEEVEKGVGALSKNLKGDLQELIRRSTVPGDLEPLAVRDATELWLSSEPDARNLNKIITGFADLFTQEDIKSLDCWLVKKVSDPGFNDVQGYSATCQIQKSSQDDGFDIQVVCPVSPDSKIAMQSANFVIRSGKVQRGVVDNLFFMVPTQTVTDGHHKQCPTGRVGLRAQPYNMQKPQALLPAMSFRFRCIDRTGSVRG